MLSERHELEENIRRVLNQIRHDKNAVEKIKAGLGENKVLPGEAQKIINEETPLEELSLSLLCLLTIQLHKVTNDDKINPYGYFTEKEIKVAKRQEFLEKDEEMNFPLVIDNVLQLDVEDYITVLPISFIVKLFNANLLEYNFETQRNARFVKRKDKIVQTPNINMRSVKDIMEHVKNNTYLPDMITLNVLAGSAEEGDEITYDAGKQQLIIHKSEIDILDGFHRITAFVRVLEENPDIDMNINVAIKNYSVRKAQAYVAQINTINKMDVGHLKALKADRYSDFVTKEIQRESDLRGKISQTSRPIKLQGHLVAYSTLSDTIDEVFTMKNKREAMEVAEYLIKFFDYLVASYPDAFIDEIDQVYEKSLINHNVTFAGYVVLAKRMLDQGIPVSKLKDILDKVDFSKDNPVWTNIGVLENGRVGRKARKAMKKFFAELDLEGVTKSNAV